MKETTKWDNKPRWMWVWDDDEEGKIKAYVAHILSKEEMKEADTIYPVITKGDGYKHCAEIETEETKKRNIFDLLRTRSASEMFRC